MHNSMMEKREYGQERNPFQMGMSHGTIEEEKYHRQELSRSRELDEYLSRKRESSTEKVQFKLNDADGSYQLRKPSTVMKATL